MEILHFHWFTRIWHLSLREGDRQTNRLLHRRVTD